MKLRNIFLAGLSAVALASCSDYLDVDAPSKNPPEYVFSDKKEMRNALNGVYAAMLSNNTYGQNFIEKFSFNTDVEFKINDSEFASSSAYQRYECDPDGGEIKKAWDDLYVGVERANMLIDGIENAAIYDEDDDELMQMLGEVKVLRAIFYHDLIWYFGDVPYSLLPSYKAPSKIYDVEDRTKILSELIEDVKGIAPRMQLSTAQSFTDGRERISKDMAWAMVARLAMTAGGYSLRSEGEDFGTMKRPDNYKEFYQTAAAYCDSVVLRSSHTLSMEYHEVFAGECNYDYTPGDDVIWEIPFGTLSTGNVGYIHGPKMDSQSGVTPHAWGKASSSAQLNALYRFLFDEDDVRRDFVNQLFGYNNQGEAQLNNGRTNYNGKWSKLWNKNGLGAASEGNTGFNFPYMRYADVLLMSAEAENELNGAPTAKALDRYEQVRRRAFPTKPEKAAYSGSMDKDSFLKAVLDERKFEFAGENMRWRDLVRNNMLGENLFWTFFRYYAAADRGSGYDSAVGEYDFGNGSIYDQKWMNSLYYLNNVPNNGYYSFSRFPQASPNVRVVYIVNPYRLPASGDEKVKIKVDGKDQTVARADYMNWFDENTSKPTAHFLYSLRGYIYCNESGNILINDNGNYVGAPNPSTFPTVDQLPAVRYILPYPRAVITRSQGKYVNKYGYR